MMDQMNPEFVLRIGRVSCEPEWLRLHERLPMIQYRECHCGFASIQKLVERPENGETHDWGSQSHQSCDKYVRYVKVEVSSEF
jgi:hypothetical protein